MTFIVIIMFLFSLYCVFNSYMNKYSWMFVITTWSTIGIMYVTFLLISINGNYITTGYVFDRLDREMFITIVQNKLYLFTLHKLYNLFSAIFLCTITVLTNSYIYKNEKIFRLSPNQLIVFAFSIISVIFYDPETTLSLYAKTQLNPGLKNLVYSFDMFLYIATYLILLYPIILLIFNRKYLISTYRKRQITGVSIYIILSNILYVILNNISAMHVPYFFRSNQSIISIQTYGAKINREYLIYLIMMFLILIINFYITSKFNVFRNEGVLTSFFVNRRKMAMNKNFYQIFHGVKNIILSYKIALSDAINTDGEAKEQSLKKLEKKMDDYLVHISSMLDTNLKLNGFYESTVYASDVIDEAISKLDISDNIVIEKRYTSHKEQLYVDSMYVVEALFNIFENAIQAVEKNDKEDKKIIVSVDPEFSWTVISVSDNGIGMDRKKQKHIFDPFFTDKSRIHNWGIGLYYAKNIIEQHHGKISLKSRPEQGTTFHILFPKN